MIASRRILHLERNPEPQSNGSLCWRYGTEAGDLQKFEAKYSVAPKRKNRSGLRLRGSRIFEEWFGLKNPADAEVQAGSA